MSRRYLRWSALAAALALVSVCQAGCDPYERFISEESAGAVDPVDFMPEYLGLDPYGDPADPKFPGSALITPSIAVVGGEEVAYYAFPASADVSIAVEGQLVVPIAYQFDEDGTSRCVAPENYVFDQQRDAVRFDQQGNIFTALPNKDEGYTPVVAEVVVRSNQLRCQDVKSEKSLVAREDVTVDLIPPENANVDGAHPTGKPSGRYFARPIIDPTIDVRGPAGLYGFDADGNPYEVDPNTGLGPQRWGWYNRYLLAYLDGGEIPTFDHMVDDGLGGQQLVTDMIPQAIYFPTQHPGVDEDGNAVVVDGGFGEGFEILSAKRGESGYSPLCEIYSFVPADPTAPEANVKDIDMSTAEPTGEFVWCIQVTK